MFDKADEAEQVELAREEIALAQQAEEAEGDARKRILMRINVRKKQLAYFSEREAVDVKDPA